MSVLDHRTSMLIVGVVAGSILLPLRSAAEGEFDHTLHVEDMGMECGYCHEQAESSRVGTDDLLPDAELCADCHDEGTIAAALPVGRASRVDRFDHAVHAERGLPCAVCHEDDGGRFTAPEKAGCRGCHSTQASLGDCAMCHSEGAELVPADHGPGWESWHGVEAGAADDSCANCHAQTDCQQCHSGENVDPRVHELGFDFSHALEARTASTECAVCHQDASFCSSCHIAEQILPEDHSSADWAVPYGDGGMHAIEAILDLESCIACHDNATQPLCADCHGR